MPDWTPQLPGDTAGLVLILWDIDRTLIDTAGIDEIVWTAACRAVVQDVPIDVGFISGSTDPLIVKDTLGRAGLATEAVEALLPQALQAGAAELGSRQDELRRKGRVLPGARAVLRFLATAEGIVQTVLTGNIRPNAELKLGTFGLSPYLRLECGAYGSDAPRRSDLVAVARQRVLGATRSSQVLAVVVGDTIRDIDSAHHAGVPAVAVCTGPHDTEQLKQAGADAVLSDLSDAQPAIETILAAAVNQ